MKVILLQDLPGTGKRNDIINTSDGYARNYLFPKKLAMEASKANLNALNNAEKARAHKKDVDKDAAESKAKELSGKVLNLSVRAGETGRLFGAVTSQEVADAIQKEWGMDVDKRKINLPNIKSVGEYEAELKLYANVATKIQLVVKSE